MDLAENIERVRERIAAACARAGRDPSEVTLIAVSKTFPAEAVLEAHRLGVCDFGENRVEEAGEKIPNIKLQVSNQIGKPASLQSIRPPASDLRSPISGLRWHLVGHLQSRKAREAIALFDVIHSVDSLKLADKLSRLCIEAGRVMPILLECNVSGEASKYGFPLAISAERERWFGEVEAMLALPGVRVEGLMTVAPIVADPNQARPVFRALRQLRDDLAARFPQTHWRHLSMGMTDDFGVAIEEGATMVRIGRAIFGERHPE
jgi:pyridoxal phosphate enzyme (YggS family)